MSAALILALVISYFLGAIPFGFIVGHMQGIDIRAVGSGNIGATNVWRILGPKAGSLVFALDVLKGLAATYISGMLVHSDHIAIAICGVVVVLGHTFSVFLKFKGGKGIATAFGAMLGMVPLVALSCFALWAVVLLFSRIISIASIAACISTPFFLYLLQAPREYGTVVIFLSMIGLWKHLPNMRRLIEGTEPKMGAPKPAANTEVSSSGLTESVSKQ